MAREPRALFVAAALVAAAWNGTGWAEDARKTTRSERPEPIHLVCGLVDGKPACTDDVATRWMDGNVPKPARMPRPEYPPRLLSRGLVGWVLTEFTVDESGAVTNAAIVESKPAGVFDRAALRTVRRFKYDPPTFAGRRVSVRVAYEAGGADHGSATGRQTRPDRDATYTMRAEFLPLRMRDEKWLPRLGGSEAGDSTARGPRLLARSPSAAR